MLGESRGDMLSLEFGLTEPGEHEWECDQGLVHHGINPRGYIRKTTETAGAEPETENDSVV